MRRSCKTTGPFRDKRGLLLGVLKGLGRHFGIAPWILRVVAITLAALTSFWAVLLVYLAGALIMPVRPDFDSLDSAIF